MGYQGSYANFSKIKIYNAKIFEKSIIFSTYHQVECFLVRFPDPPYGVGREKEPPRRWEKNFEAT